MNKRIHDDLFKRIRDRHYDWAADSADLYEMGELSSRDIAQDIMTICIDFVCNGMVALEVDEKSVFETMTKLIARRRARVKEAGKDEL
jgi:hypothetical protein